MATPTSTLTVLALLLVVFVALAESSIYRTTITTSEITDENESQSERCRREVSMEQMRECRQYLQSGRRQVLRGGVINQQVPQMCCERLRQVREDCRCEAVKQMAEEQMGELRGEEMQEMIRRAENLPDMCGMRPQHCDIRGRAY
ncbi:2S seed storage albumin protein-like [Tasmannia lanceolata]|uniref:2S seed storage albumin protein-like n=1 Tax=Tasmannia lanceolata TaxID=3420 RepID=UPI0040638CB8